MSYVIHSTRTVDNLLRILSDGYVNNVPTGDTMLSLEHHPKQIFTQLVYKGIPNEQTQRPFWIGQSCIVFKPHILRELAFYATDVGGFSTRFADGLSHPSNLASGSGKLDRMPNLAKLKNRIEVRTQQKNLRGLAYIHSHEILFGRRIYLSRFCECVVVQDGIHGLNKIKEWCDKRKIPLRIFDGDTGIDGFVDVIR